MNKIQEAFAGLGNKDADFPVSMKESSEDILLSHASVPDEFFYD